MQSNGQAEKTIKTLKKLLKMSKDVPMALLTYHSTPFSWCHLSPAELLMARRLRANIPLWKINTNSSLGILGRISKEQLYFQGLPKTRLRLPPHVPRPYFDTERFRCMNHLKWSTSGWQKNHYSSLNAPIIHRRHPNETSKTKPSAPQPNARGPYTDCPERSTFNQRSDHDQISDVNNHTASEQIVTLSVRRGDVEWICTLCM